MQRAEDPSTSRVRLGTASLDGQLDMSGLNLVRHHLQQAQAHANYLPGGEGRDTVLEDDVLSIEDAAAGVREDLQNAIDALDVAQLASEPETRPGDRL